MIERFNEPHPPLKTDEALRLSWQIRNLFGKLDHHLSNNGQFPVEWITKENQTKPN